MISVIFEAAYTVLTSEISHMLLRLMILILKRAIRGSKHTLQDDDPLGLQMSSCRRHYDHG
jgi:hypothetical protein